ncbi:MAG TPA: S9 family peptidase [Candidatus Baltobacteraceae bacterium]|nr:S9 family peptidase [Candidatus Baltobacteraceae bacterium]
MRRSLRTLVPVAAAVFAAATCVSGSAAPRGLALDDLRDIVGVSSPAISPDGSRAAIVVTRIVWDDDTYERTIDLVDLKTHAHRSLTSERKGLGDPRWSPDGTKLAFLAATGSGEDARTQVFVMPMDGGDARPVTKAPEGVEQFAWRPDGGAIAYAASDADPKKHGAARFRDAFVFTTEPITERKPPKPVHLFVIPADGGTARQLTTGNDSVTTGEAQSTLSWSPDGKTIAFLMAPNAILNDSNRAHVDLVDVATRKLTRLTSHDGYEADPRFSPDGKHIVYLHSNGDNQINLTEAYVAPASGGEGTPISRPYDRAVGAAVWMPDGSAIAFACHDGTSLALVRAPLDGAAPARVDLGDVNVASPLDDAFARDGAMVFVGTTSTQPSELYYRPANGKPVRVTDYSARIAALALAPSETIAFPTSLGRDGDAVLTKPVAFSAGRRYPLLVYIHGGPTSASTRSFDRVVQLAASRGWLVLQPNYRGSDNLGLVYQRAVRYDPGAGPGADIMAAVDAVRARGIVDDHRIGVYGWSYGGIMTAWMISKYHVWRAAVSGASVNDWTTDYGVADDSDSDRALFHGSPFVAGNRAEWDRASAISYVRDVTTPVLILSDVGDNRDPFATSSMYWRALRDNHKDATLVAYPVDGHFPRDPVRGADVYQRTLDFIAAHFR